MDNELENIPNFVISCCRLHNICQISGDDFIDNDDILPDLLANEQRMRERRQVNGQVNIAGNEQYEQILRNISISKGQTSEHNILARRVECVGGGWGGGGGGGIKNIS